MGNSSKVKNYLRVCKYRHFFYFWHCKFYRRLLVLLFAKESGLKHGFHQVQYDGMIRKMKEEAFQGDFEKSFRYLFGKKFTPLVMRIITMMKQFAVEIERSDTPIRSTDMRIFWKQTDVTKVLRELLFARVHHMQLENLINDEYGFYGGVYWLATELEAGNWEIVEPLLRYAKNQKRVKPKILLACMCVDSEESKRYLQEHVNEDQRFVVDALPQFHRGIFFSYLCNEFSFENFEKYSSISQWTGLYDMNEEAERKLCNYLQKAANQAFDIQKLDRNWMAAYTTLFILGADDLESLKSGLKTMVEQGAPAHHRGIMRFLSNPNVAFLKQEVTFYAEGCDNLELLAFLFDSWQGIRDKTSDFNFQALRPHREQLLHIFVSWLDKLPMTDYIYQADDFLGRSFTLYRHDVCKTAMILATDCGDDLGADAQKLCDSLDELDKETIIKTIPMIFNFADRTTLKQTLLRFCIHEDEDISKIAMKSLRNMQSSLNLYNKPYIHCFKRMAYLDYMDPINNDDLDFLHQHVPDDHEVFQVIGEHKKVKITKPDKTKSIAQKATPSFGKMLAQKDEFKPNQMTKFFKEGLIKDRSPFSSFSADLLAHFVRSYQEQGKKACEQLNFKQTVYVHFRLFALPDMSIFSKLMYAKMDLLFHIKQFRDQGKASLSHIDTKQMNQDLLDHMLQFDLNEYAMFFLRMLEQVNTVMDKTYLTTYYRVKPYQVDNEHGIDAEFIQYWIYMGRLAQNDETKRATTKYIYQIAQKGSFYNLCGLTLQDIDYLYQQKLLQKCDIKALFIPEYAPKKVMEDHGQWTRQLFHERYQGTEFSDELNEVFTEIENDFVTYLLGGGGYTSECYPINNPRNVMKLLNRINDLQKDDSVPDELITLLNGSLIESTMELLDVPLEKKLLYKLADLNIPELWSMEVEDLQFIVYPYQKRVPEEFKPIIYGDIMNTLLKLNDEMMSTLDNLCDSYEKVGLVHVSLMKQAINNEFVIDELETTLKEGHNKELAVIYSMLPFVSEDQTRRQVTFLMDRSPAYTYLFPILGAISGYEDIHVFEKTFL